jgi:hypothetical protein
MALPLHGGLREAWQLWEKQVEGRVWECGFSVKRDSSVCAEVIA